MIVAYIDGGARGNPGPAGYGVRIESPDGTLVDELHGGLGIATNNVAEYNGLLAALQWALDHDDASVHIRADSELLVKQMRGEYKVKNTGLQPLLRPRPAAGRPARQVRFEHVRREFNKEADRLSNLGMDDAEARSCGKRGSEINAYLIIPVPRSALIAPTILPACSLRRDRSGTRRRGSSCRDRRRECARPARQPLRVDRRWRRHKSR